MIKTTNELEEETPTGRIIGEDKYDEHWSLDRHTYVEVPKWIIKQIQEQATNEAFKKGFVAGGLAYLKDNKEVVKEYKKELLEEINKLNGNFDYIQGVADVDDIIKSLKD